MNARLKLNSANIHGALVLAGLLGWVFGSWELFLIAALVLIITAISLRLDPYDTHEHR